MGVGPAHACAHPFKGRGIGVTQLPEHLSQRMERTLRKGAIHLPESADFRPLSDKSTVVLWHFILFWLRRVLPPLTLPGYGFPFTRIPRLWNPFDLSLSTLSMRHSSPVAESRVKPAREGRIGLVL
ncbi:hypothetical protein V6N11_019770 [Hibiscus sabdariffa]|uniref:Uncharacterized protein n=2 Tax=Hibiscus sabdariffa TaxID=183260 RepID=A0ABR2BMS4_9ROSI